MRNLLIILTIFMLSSAVAHASDNIIIPKNIKKLPLSASDVNDKKLAVNIKTDDINIFYHDTPLIYLISDFTYKSNQKSGIAVKNIFRKSVNERLILKDIKTNSATKSYTNWQSNEYAISPADIDFSSSLLGAIKAGVSAGYDSYLNRGVVDLSYTARSGALMLGSIYAGYMLTSYAENVLIKPIVTSVVTGSAGLGVASIFGDVVGGVTVGSLFAIGAYATGSVDRHAARLLITKSAVGSTATASITFLLGTSTVATGVFSFGTLIIPYLTAFGTYYAVDKLFQVLDKIEEGERVGAIVNNRRQ